MRQRTAPRCRTHGRKRPDKTSRTLCVGQWRRPVGGDDDMTNHDDAMRNADGTMLAADGGGGPGGFALCRPASSSLSLGW